MVARIDFFLSINEERTFIEYLQSNNDIEIFVNVKTGTKVIVPLAVSNIPPWPNELNLYIWLKSAGAIKWFSSEPDVNGKSHIQLVNNLFANLAWKKLKKEDNDHLINLDLSPVLAYHRSKIINNKILPGALISNASSAERVSSKYATWVKRCQGWVRRKGKNIHSSKHEHPSLENPSSYVNTTYAFPEALKEIGEYPSKYAISQRNA